MPWASPNRRTPWPSQRIEQAVPFPTLFKEISLSDVAAKLLEDNAALIHAKNIQNGKTSEQSKHELESLCLLLRHLTTIRFDVVQYAERMQIELHGGWK